MSRLAFFLASLVISLPVASQPKPLTAAAAKPASSATAGKPAPEGGTMKPGVWEVTTVIETVGSPTKRTVAARTCLGADDVVDVRRIVPPQRDFGLKCETTDARRKADDVTWRVACTGKEGTLAGSGKMSIAPESFTGSADLEKKAAGAKPVKVSQKLAGKWIEACK